MKLSIFDTSPIAGPIDGGRNCKSVFNWQSEIGDKRGAMG
jgi:hypothetical protein